MFVYAFHLLYGLNAETTVMHTTCAYTSTPNLGVFICLIQDGQEINLFQVYLLWLNHHHQFEGLLHRDRG